MYSDPKSGLESKKFLLDIPFLGGGWPYFGLHTHIQDRLDKSYSALAVCATKNNKYGTKRKERRILIHKFIVFINFQAYIGKN